MPGNHRMIFNLLPPAAIRHIGDIVIKHQRIFVLCADGRTRQRRQDAELRIGVVIAQRIHKERSGITQVVHGLVGKAGHQGDRCADFELVAGADALR